MTEALLITTKPRDDHQLEMHIQLGPERTEETLLRALKLVAKKVRIPGFRPGKAPHAAILRQYGRETLLREIIDDLGQEVFKEALADQEISLYGKADLTDMTVDPPAFTLVLPLQPTVELGDYRSIRLEAPTVNVTEADVAALIAPELESRAPWETVERPAAIGDTIVMDIQGTVGETSIMDNHDWELLLKEESGWLPGFDAAFVGVQAGEVKDFALTYPEGSSSRFKGQQASFHAVVKTVKSKTTPELTDELAKTLGEYESVADLRTKLLESLTKRRTADAENKFNEDAIAAVIAGATIAFPPQAVDDTVHDMVHDLEHRVQEIGYTLEDYLRLQSMTREQYEQQARPSAEQRLKGRLVLGELAKREGLTVSAEEAQAEFDRLIGQAEEPAHADELRKLFGSDAGQAMIRQGRAGSRRDRTHRSRTGRGTCRRGSADY
ncbi:MAG: trigger factor [Chloroflexi bacterium]|nr:trigger factor [Chloroflexota bacterium]